RRPTLRHASRSGVEDESVEPGGLWVVVATSTEQPCDEQPEQSPQLAHRRFATAFFTAAGFFRRCGCAASCSSSSIVACRAATRAWPAACTTASECACGDHVRRR